MKVLIITGPTGTGKSDFAIQCAHRLGGEIINADAGQFYAPLAIGTAMPCVESETVPHHLFGHIKSPVQATVPEWFGQASAEIAACMARGNVPIVVGGSGFYVSSLFYPITHSISTERFSRDAEGAGFEGVPTEELHERLVQIDARRAREIHHNDRYRIIRALQIGATGVLPSEVKPLFQPAFRPALVVYVDRQDSELKQRIENRIMGMLKAGWVEEVEGLTDTWKKFALHRGFIGYKNLIELPAGAHVDISCRTDIAHETWSYVRRQRKYLRSFKRKLESAGDSEIVWKEFCLTSENSEVYLDQIQSLYAS